MAEKIKGGLADNMTIEDLARKHSQFVGTMKKELEKGIKVEKEHTNNVEKAREIAMDHLYEDPRYYEELEKMEDKLEKTEPQETTMAGSSGSYEAPMSAPVTKKAIENFKLKSNLKKEEPKESTTASVSAGAMYDAPIGGGRKDPLQIDNPTMKKVEEDGPIMGNKKLDSKTNLNLPKWVKGGKYVGVNKTPPNKIGRNSGDPKNYTIYENPLVKQAIQGAAKKFGITEEKVLEIIVKRGGGVKEGIEDIDFSPAQKWFKEEPKTIYRVTTEEPVHIETSDESELAKLHIIFSKHKIKFNVEERGTEEDNLE